MRAPRLVPCTPMQARVGVPAAERDAQREARPHGRAQPGGIPLWSVEPNRHILAACLTRGTLIVCMGPSLSYLVIHSYKPLTVSQYVVEGFLNPAVKQHLLHVKKA